MSKSAVPSAVTVTNISCYKFAALSDLKALRERLVMLCRGWELKGTILLSPEGINLFVAGGRPEIDLLLTELRSLPGLEDLTPKISESETQPFRRMLVRLKKEIIAFGVEGIEPARYTSRRIDARTLKQWLDEGRPVALLDTRNDYEVKMGTFRGAMPIGISHFREFPKAVRQIPDRLKTTPVVTFCTGGIRCEKAAPLLEREGFEQIYQLDGGILKYFEEVGGEHYDGECFVFDQRVGVDPALQETESTQCFVCQSPLTEAEQKDERFAHGRSCPYCFKTTEEQRRASIVEREELIRRVTSPLPGSVPYDNLRPLTVPDRCDGMTLLDFLMAILPHSQREDWLALCDRKRLLDPRNQAAAADRVVRAGERFVHLLPATCEPGINANIHILHEDEALVVLHKPAPLPMHPGGRFNRNTLQFILNLAYHPQKLRPGHRLDANTTGLVLFTRTRHFAGLLQPQFSRGEVEKVYLARVQGHPVEDSFVCDEPISSEPGARGSRDVDDLAGRESKTDCTVLRRDADGTALLDVRPLTGRTNQIRIHFWRLGYPICGDQTYLPNQMLGDTQTAAVADAPLCLHAWKLSFRHPQTGRPMAFEAERPGWAA